MSLALQIETESGVPVYVQLERQIRVLLRRGQLRAGQPMPTVRQLAVELGLNYNTVARVYRDLQQDGVLVLRRGIGTFIAQGVIAKPLSESQLRKLEQRIDQVIDACRQLRIPQEEACRMIEDRWPDSPE